MTLDAGQVFGASERLQPSIEAPASVSLITAEEIKRNGYRTLADILNAVRGMYIVDDRNDSVRGGTLAGLEVSAAATVNVTMIQPLGSSWELSGSMRNIFDARYSDPVSSQHRQDAISQNGRTARIGLRWKLWTT
jgi:outer membrane cobalamin receptor